MLTFCNPMAVPDESTVFFFRGSQDSHKVPTTRLSPNSLVAPIPCKCVLILSSTSEGLSVSCPNEEEAIVPEGSDHYSL